MEIEFQLTREPIAEKISPPARPGMAGAWLEFRGVVRGGENGQAISALEYQAYPEMAEREIRRLLTEISTRHPCLAAKVIHRVGVIPVGDTAIYVGVASPHRREAIALLAEFMDHLNRMCRFGNGARLPEKRGCPSRSPGKCQARRGWAPRSVRSTKRFLT